MKKSTRVVLTATVIAGTVLAGILVPEVQADSINNEFVKEISKAEFTKCATTYKDSHFKEDSGLWYKQEDPDGVGYVLTPTATPQAIPEMKSAPILAYIVPTIAKVIEIQIPEKTKGTLTQDFKKHTVFVSEIIKDEGIDTDIFGEKKLSIYLEEKNIYDTKKVNRNQIIESLQSDYVNGIRTNEALSSSPHSEDHNKINVLPKTGEIKSVQEGLSLMGFGLIMIAGAVFVGKKQKNCR